MSKPSISPVQRYYVTATGKQRALNFGLVMFGFWTIRYLVEYGFTPATVVLIPFYAGIAVFGGVFFGRVMQRQLDKRDEQLGITLTDDEKIELFQWVRHGIRPTSQRLQPILGKYLDYAQSDLQGVRMHTSWTGYYAYIALFGLMLLGSVWLLLSGPITTGGVLMVIAFAMLITFGASSPPGKRNVIYAFLYRRQINRIKHCRKQLTSEAR